MNIPTVKDYQDVYDELRAHCDFFSEREPLRKEVIEKINSFMSEFGEFLHKCGELPVISYGDFLQIIQISKEPYHSEDIRRVAEYIYIACEMGIKFPHYYEDRYRAIIRHRLTHTDPWEY